MALRTILVSVLCVPAMAVAALAQYQSAAEHPAIAYSKSAPTDAMAKLQQEVEAGTATLAYDKDHGYLPAILSALKVPVASQGLVLSKTSLQVDKIAPWSPRAIYFSDDVYVGWVQGGPIMEVASVDPTLGAVFYTVAQEPGAKPTITRQTRTCLQCHDSASSTGGVPGFIMRSVIADRHGYPVSSDLGGTTDQTPVSDRWGGWYVTGTIPAAHLGNVFAPKLAGEMGNVQAYLAKTKLASDEKITDLSGKFDVAPYLAPHSDAVALLVLAHQTYVHNLITAAGYQARSTPDDTMRIEGAAERLVRAMLLAKEATLPGAVSGTSSFAADFAKAGPHDSRGRSLRDLDLQTRVFKYPFSYLVYSDSFDALPPVVKTYVYRRVREVLGGKDQRAEFAHLTPDLRQAISEILTETKPGFAE